MIKIELLQFCKFQSEECNFWQNWSKDSRLKSRQLFAKEKKISKKRQKVLFWRQRDCLFFRKINNIFTKDEMKQEPSSSWREKAKIRFLLDSNFASRHDDDDVRLRVATASQRFKNFTYLGRYLVQCDQIGRFFSFLVRISFYTSNLNVLLIFWGILNHST